MAEQYVATLPHGWKLRTQIPEGAPVLVRGAERLRPHEMLHCGGVYDLYREARVLERFTKDRSARSDWVHDPKWKALFSTWTTLEALLRLRLQHARDSKADRTLDNAPKAEIEAKMMQEVT